MPSISIYVNDELYKYLLDKGPSPAVAGKNIIESDFNKQKEIKTVTNIKPLFGPFNAESNAADTRALIDATRLHQKQFPTASLEISFMHTMRSTLTFRKLPVKCYACARMKLGLPDAGIVELKTEDDQQKETENATQ